MQKIISWNVASIRARLQLFKKLLKTKAPDVLFLQEIKVEENKFPFEELKDFGYHIIVSGQKSFNGVAIFSKSKINPLFKNLDGFEDQARFIEVEMNNGVHLISVYVPNGTAPMNDPTDTSRLEYKLRWMSALNQRLDKLLSDRIPFVMGGDFNVIVKDTDVYNPLLFKESALMVPSVRQKWKEMEKIGVVNVIRHLNKQEGLYSFWDFQGGAWFKNNGILLDAICISPDLLPTLIDSGVEKEWRGQEKPSDHAPVWCQMNR